MKRILAVSIIFVVALCFAQIKLPLTHVVPSGFTIHSIEILTNPTTFYENDKIGVGVKINFMRAVAGANVYSFELKEGEIKLMSLRLIGLKLSETETNFLVYNGPTSAFPSNYEYGGFQIVGFYVTKADLDAGYKEIWGWTNLSPLPCRDFYIVADLDVDPVYGQPLAGYHIGEKKVWTCTRPVTSPFGRCQFTEKTGQTQPQQPSAQYYQPKDISDIIVEPEPFELGQPLKINVVVNSEPASSPWDYYMVYWVTVTYSNGQTRTIPHSYGNFNPNSAIIITSNPKSKDIRTLVLDRPGPISYTLPESITITQSAVANIPITQVEIKVQIWAGLDADRFSPYNFTERWQAKTVFVPVGK
ncbi:MAG: hypothetical protein ACK4E2_06330 [Pseudothermotoga sp.]